MAHRILNYMPTEEYGIHQQGSPLSMGTLSHWVTNAIWWSGYTQPTPKGMGYAKWAAHYTQEAQLLGDSYNTVEDICIAQHMQRDNVIGAHHGPWDPEIFAHPKEWYRPIGLVVKHGNTYPWADPYNKMEGIYPVHCMKQDRRIWLSITYGDTHILSCLHDMGTVYPQPTVWNGIIREEPAMAHSDTRINAYRKGWDTLAGLSVIHRNPQLLGDPYDVVHSI